MKTTLQVFVRRLTSKSHEQVTIHFDWAGLSPADIQQMAALYVAGKVTEELKKAEQSLPERHYVLAQDYLHKEPVVDVPQYDPSRAKVRYRVPKHLEEALKGLTKEELTTLLGVQS